MTELLLAYKKKKKSYYKSGNVWLKIPEFIKNHDWEVDKSGKYLKTDMLGLLRLQAAAGDLDKFVGSKKLLNIIISREDQFILLISSSERLTLYILIFCIFPV